MKSGAIISTTKFMTLHKNFPTNYEGASVTSQWCANVNVSQKNIKYQMIYIKQEGRDLLDEKPKNFNRLISWQKAVSRARINKIL